jgi:hypothetical protein
LRVFLCRTLFSLLGVWLIPITALLQVFDFESLL